MLVDIKEADVHQLKKESDVMKRIQESDVMKEMVTAKRATV